MHKTRGTHSHRRHMLSRYIADVAAHTQAHTEVCKKRKKASSAVWWVQRGRETKRGEREMEGRGWCWLWLWLKEFPEWALYIERGIKCRIASSFFPLLCFRQNEQTLSHPWKLFTILCPICYYAILCTTHNII